MINPITFCGPPQQSQKYKDPLNMPLMQMASYSSEIGTAIIEIAPKLGTALWAPSLMYLGADIYDKYKNDKTEFNPSARRAFERAIYQGVFNLVCLPTMIYLGQKAVSPFGKLTKDGISTNAKDAVFKHTKDVIEQLEGDNFDKPENFKLLLQKTLSNKINALKQEKKHDNIFKKAFNFFQDKYSLVDNNEQKIKDFASKNADRLFEVKHALEVGEKHKVPSLVLKKYQKALPEFMTIYETLKPHSALKTALKEYQNMNIFQNKILKTLGGFMPIIFLARPVSNFVENIIVDKYVDQGLNGITNGFVNNSYIKKIFNEMDKANTDQASQEKETTMQEAPAVSESQS